MAKLSMLVKHYSGYLAYQRFRLGRFNQISDWKMIDDRAEMVNAALGTSCAVGMHAKVIQSQLANHATIGPHAVIIKSQLGQFSRIGRATWAIHSTVGLYSYAADNAILRQTIVGKFSSIAMGVHIGLPQHPTTDFVSTHPIFYSHNPDYYQTWASSNHFDTELPTHIGNDVWIGANALIKSGITIGDGAIIGAGAVVTKDIPPYAIYAGVPAKLIRYRFSQKEIDRLLETRWWDESLEWLQVNYKRFHSIRVFLNEEKCDSTKDVEFTS